MYLNDFQWIDCHQCRLEFYQTKRFHYVHELELRFQTEALIVINLLSLAKWFFHLR